MRRVAACVLALATPLARGAAAPFYTGADVSLGAFLQSRGASYRDGGVTANPEQILANHGANLFRVRLFVNPSANYDAADNRGAIQDLASAIALAQRVKATGAKVELALHYSDTWSDPGHQATPAAWAGQDLATMKTTVQTYTANTLTAFKNAGVLPDIVQVGNEVTAGMLWNNGKVNFASQSTINATLKNFGGLMNAAIAGVRTVQATAGRHIDVSITEAPGDDYYNASVGGGPRYFYDNLMNTAGVTDFDIMGVDSYPTTKTMLNGLVANLNDLATRYTKRVMVMETNYAWNDSLDGTGTGQYSAATEPFPTTPAGQAAYYQYITNVVRNLPNDRGAGVLWWYPEATPTPKTYIYQGGATGLFDASGNALPSLIALPEPTTAAAALVGVAAVALRRRHAIRRPPVP